MLLLRQAAQLEALDELRAVRVESFPHRSGSHGSPKQRAAEGQRLREEYLRGLEKRAGLLPDDMDLDDMGRQQVSMSELKDLIASINDDGRRKKRRRAE